MAATWNRRELLLAVAAGGLAGAAGAATGERPASAWASQKKFSTINGVRMAYYEAGRGDPIVFLHGNPTSSYLWRNIIPHVSHLGRCIAPDLVGMGDSDPLPDSGPGRYTFVNHREYLFGLFEDLGLARDVVLVVHDWGSALGFSWAQQHPDQVKGIAYMEAIVQPPAMPQVDDTGGGFFARLRSPAGEQLVLEENMFVEQLFIGGLEHYLSEQDKAEYRRPYLEPGESRRPTLTWPREVPLGGEPAVNEQIVRNYSAWLAQSEIPKLFVRANPGAIFAAPPMLAFARSFPNQQEVSVYGGHFVQEVSPDAIGRALAGWLESMS
jgi:haloalkane dehalogenase